MLTSDFRRVSNISLEKIKLDQKTMEEKEKLKEENEAFRGENQNLLNRCEELELKVKKLTGDIEVWATESVFQHYLTDRKVGCK